MSTIYSNLTINIGQVFSFTCDESLHKGDRVSIVFNDSTGKAVVIGGSNGLYNGKRIE